MLCTRGVYCCNRELNSLRAPRTLRLCASFFLASLRDMICFCRARPLKNPAGPGFFGAMTLTGIT